MNPIEVRGVPTAEEMAAVLAVLRGARPTDPPDPSSRWRATRLAALKRDQPGPFSER